VSARQLYSTPLALALGLLLAVFLPSGAPWLGWLGEVFLSLLKVLILPLILVSIYRSLASGADVRRLGLLTLSYYLLTSATAATLGTVAGFTLSGNLSAESANPAQVTESAARFSLQTLIHNLVPANVFDSLAEGHILHIVVIAVFAALASRSLPATHRQFLLAGARAFDALLMQMLRTILALAPIGVLALVYASLAGMDWDAIFEMKSFVWAVALASLVHALVFLPALYYARTRRSPWRFLRDVRAALATAFSTASSSATYPVSKQVLERNVGVSSGTTSFTLPLGATLNMDGSALYQSILLIFLAQLAGAEVTLFQSLFIVLLTMASSAGTAGMPAGGIAMMAFMLDLLGLPPTYLALYLIVDRFFDYPITAINVWGDLIVTALVDRELATSSRPERAASA
jgi:Na+/H+-dicarboxylate symporter